MATVTPNFNWPVPTSTDLVKDGATAIEGLGDAIDASLLDLKGGTTGQVLAKNSNTDMDFVWAAPTTGDITGVTAGTGITGGGTSGDVTVSFDVANYGGGQGAAGKNAVINGGFDIWQRGTSFSNPTSIPSAYSADRWMAYRGSGFTSGVTSSRQSSGLTGFNYNIRVQRTAGNTSTVGIYLAQTFETVNSIPFAGKTVTLSFYARKGADYSNAGSTINAQVNTGTGTDENGPINGFTGNANIINQNATLTTSWQRFSYTGTIGSTATEINIVFSDIPVGTAGTNDYFEITGVQLELGSTATTFSRAGGNIQGELAACQRYYWRLTGASAGYYRLADSAVANSTTDCTLSMANPVVMRVTPTSVDYAGVYLENYVGAGSKAATSLTIKDVSNPQITSANVGVASGLTAGTRYFGFLNNNTSSYLGYSAEL